MNKMLSVSCLVVGTLSSQAQAPSGFPSEEQGMEKGVSACVAGILGDQLIVAGGCNFPDKPVAEGGAKKYYEGIYAAKADGLSPGWRRVGTLPAAAAYGASIQAGDTLFFVGGNNEHHALASAWRLQMDGGGELRLDTLPMLPCSLDNMAGAAVGATLYVLGGNAGGKPSTAVYALSLGSPGDGWRKVGDLPGRPRVQPVCAAVGRKLYVWGGFHGDGERSEVFTDGWVLDTDGGAWSRLPSPVGVDGEPVTLGGGTATSIGHRIVCTGGVNRDIFLDAISGQYRLTAREDYLRHPVGWYRFNGSVLVFDTLAGRWERPSDHEAELARAGATAVAYDGGALVVGGELKPGIRTPSVAFVRP